MKDFTDISYLVSGAVARIAVTRPDKLNAYRNETADELRAALGRAEADAAIRVVIMTGEGRAFGAGYDLSTVKPEETPRLDEVLIEERLQGSYVGQLVGVDQIRSKDQSGRRVMSKNHIDS